MATVLLGVAGSAIGGAIGGSFLGVSLATIGQAVGAAIGSVIDKGIVSALTPARKMTGPRLTTTDIQASTEGSPIDRIRGRARMSGQLIWATRFEEVVSKKKSGGKGFGGPKVETTTYTYYGNFAVGLCEGPIAAVGRIWMDGKEVDQDLIDFRWYPGNETQMIDPLIEAKEGTGNAPAYRGLAYIVFERLKLTEYGNRLPQVAVEVFRVVGDLEPLVEGVAILAGSEFGCDTVMVRHDGTSGGTTENRHTLIAETDWAASLDRLQALCQNLKSVMLVVPWFGDDLRAGHCTCRPKVDSAIKKTKGRTWRVAGLSRGSALVVSEADGGPAFGGTPSDASVIAAVEDLATRGISVTLCPFLMMDVPSSNTLPDPYSDNAASIGQPAFPWRGRITASPAAGYDGTVDKTSGAADQVAAFVGTAGPDDFGGSGSTVSYSGPNEWSYRRFVLHIAKLGALAGGVDTFLIGSEMVGLTTVRSDASTYPFVAALKELAADAADMLPSAAIGYAADWTEYHSHRPDDGSGDVFFNLDPLWGDENIAFVGIDNYLPIADWRDGSAHLDYDPGGDGAGPTTIYDAGYLDANVEGGEYFDWFYASAADRDSQTRTAITDAAKGKEWVFRQKDIRSWWANAHYDRPAGVESGTATAWTAKGKPVRFIELGCPAVDKGANQPNVFPDPKSSESAYPYFSNRARDDAMQRAFLQAVLGHWSADNPESGVYAGTMLDLAHSHLWCWDVRPWPSFPLDPSWGDAKNWETGHWLSGRLGHAPGTETIRDILDEAGFTYYRVEPIPTVVDGVTNGSLTTARAMLEAVQACYLFDAVESDGKIKFQARIGRGPVASIALEDLALPENAPPGQGAWRQTRAQETELPDAVKVSYGDPARDDQPAGTEARRSAGTSSRVQELAPPAVMAENVARSLAERTLYSAWVAREKADFILPRSFMALDPGDCVTFEPTCTLLQFASVKDAEARAVEAIRVDPLALAPVRLPLSAGRSIPATVYLDALVDFVDGPLIRDGDSDFAGYVGGAMLPLGAGIALYRSTSDEAFQLDTVLPLEATLGYTTAEFYSGPVWRWDRVNTLCVELVRGALSSASEAAVLNGANAMLVENEEGEWELVQFQTATLTGTRTYNLTVLLRGQRGTEHAMADPLPAGRRVILIDEALLQTSIPEAMVKAPLAWRAGPADIDVASDSYVAQTVTLYGRGRRPLAPVHLAANWQSDGDIQLFWVRRTRVGGDSWTQLEVPLGETEERYEIEILDDDDTVLRTVTGLGAPGWLYQLSDQMIDFGAAATALKWRVYQISAAFGRGIAASWP